MSFCTTQVTCRNHFLAVMNGTLWNESRRKVKVLYTIGEGNIKIKDFEKSNEKEQPVKVYDDRLPGISFLHIKGSVQDKVNTVFEAVPGSGVILSVQAVMENTRFEFETATSFNINFAPILESIQLMSTDVNFGYNYESPGVLNRIDIYIPSEKLKTLLPEKVLMQLRKKQMLDLSVATNKFLSSLNEFLNILIKELEKPASESLHVYFENFLQSVTS